MNDVLSVYLNNHGYVDFLVTHWQDVGGSDKHVAESDLDCYGYYEIEFEPWEEKYMMCLEDYEIEEVEVQLVHQLRTKRWD